MKASLVTALMFSLLASLRGDSVDPGSIIISPQITSHPQSQVVPVGQVASFSVGATDNGPLIYHWQRSANGTGPWTDLTENIPLTYAYVAQPTLLVLQSATLLGNNGDRFRCMVSNLTGTTTSAEASLTVTSSAAPLTAAGGYNHSIFLRIDGTVWGMGRNQEGQLGDGTATGHLSPAQITNDVAQIAAGSDHMLILKRDGTLWTNGYNETGALGTGMLVSVYSPVQITTGVAAASGGYRHSLLRKTDGSLWAMGWNAYGQLGDGSTTNRSAPVQVATHVTDLAAGYVHSLFVQPDGSLWAMGNNANGQFGNGTATSALAPVQVATGVTRVAAGFYHSLILKEDGSLWATGYNASGQLGTGDTTQTLSPAPIAPGVQAIAAGALHSVFLKTDGSLWVMGDNSRGQLGLGDNTARASPLQVATEVTSVSAGLYFTHFIKADGTLWAMGANDQGQLGDGSASDRNAPVLIASGGSGLPQSAVAPVASVSDSADRVQLSWNASIGASHYEVWRATSSDKSTATLLASQISGSYFEDLTAAAGVTYYYWVNALNPFGTRDQGGYAQGRAGVTFGTPFISTQPVDQTASTGDSITFSVIATGTAPLSYQWRKDSTEITGATGSSYTINPVATADLGTYDVVVSNQAGTATSLPALLRLKTPLAITLPAAPRQVLVPGGSSSLSVAATGEGTLHYQWLHNGRPIAGANSSTLALTNVDHATNGYYFVDVSDDSETLRSATYFVLVAPWSTRVVGFGSNYNGQTQVPSDLTDAVAIAAGYTHAIALKRDGTVRAWGTGTSAGQVNAVPSSLTDVVAIAAGDSHSLALKSDGTVVEWGWNPNVPTDLANVVAISAKRERSLALQADGTIVVWDVAPYGNGSLEPPTGLKAVGHPATGVIHAVAVKPDGTVAVWGSSLYDLTTVPASLADVMAVAAGSNHTLALKPSGEVTAWGYNLAGQCTVPEGLANVIAIAAGGSHSLALQSNGHVVAWGGNTYGETSVPSDLTDVFAISAAGVYSLALREWTSDLPLITGQPSARYVFVPDPAKFSVAASGPGVLSYQWQRRPAGSVDWSDLSDDGVYSGVTTTTLRFGPTALAMNGDSFRCRVSNAFGTAVSEPALFGAMVSELNKPSVSLTLGLQRRVGQTLSITLGVGDPNSDFRYAILWIRTPDGSWHTILADNTTIPSNELSEANAITSTAGASTHSFTFTPEDGTGTYTLAAAAIDASGLRSDTSVDIVVEPNRAPTASLSVSSENTIDSTARIWFAVDDPDGNYAYSNLRVNTPNRGWLTILADNSIVLSGEISATNNSAVRIGSDTRRFTYTATDGPGTYSFALTVVDTLGERMDSPTQTVTVIALITLHEAWQTTHFTSPELADTAISGATADPDGDGLTNLIEYALDLNPKSADTTGLPEMGTSATDWTYTYTRPAYRPDLNYEVETSTDLVNWTTTGVTHTMTADNGTTQTWQASVPVGSASNAFFRLKVTQN